jgi:hypothetical protein
MKILGDAMTPEEALRNILSLVDGSDEVEDVHAVQILLQSIKTLAEKGLGAPNNCHQVKFVGTRSTRIMSLC